MKLRIRIAAGGARWGALACGVALGLAGCASVELPPDLPPPVVRPGGPPPVEPPRLGWLSRIQVPGDVDPVLRLNGRGVQIFRCEPRGTGFAWVFRQPEAELRDPATPDGPAVVRHGANFSFEHTDGSRLLAQVVAHDDTDAQNLPWLLMTARAFGTGALAGVTHVQRVYTRGGMPPASCEAAQRDRLLRVDFQAEFVFYRPRART